MKKRKAESRVVFKIKGLNQEKLINQIIKTATIFNYQRESHNICQFEVLSGKEKQIKKILNESGAQILSFSQHGFVAKLKRIFASYGILVAIILSSVFYAVQYSFVWKIEVRGEGKVEQRSVERYINKILPSKFKPSIDVKQIEKSVKQEFAEISSVSVAIVGQTLILNLNEAVLPDEMNNEFQPLVSEFDGLITRINLIQGTLAIKDGDLVRKGDVLVYPYIIDSEGEKRAVCPRADIYADVWLEQKSMHYDYQVVSQRTGRKREINEVYLNNLLIYSNNKTNEFKQFEVEKSQSFLSNNLILPFILRKTIFYETEVVEINEDFLQVKDKIIDLLREKALLFVEENEIIKEENCTIREEGGCHEVCVVITVNRNIGG